MDYRYMHKCKFSVILKSIVCSFFIVSNSIAMFMV